MRDIASAEPVRLRDEGLRVVKSRAQAVLAMADMLARRSIIVGHHRQAAGHGFEHHVAKGFGDAGKEKQVGGSIMLGQILAHAHAGKDDVRMHGLQCCAFRPIAHHHQLHARACGLHVAEGFDQQRQVLFRRDASDIKRHQAMVADAP